MTTDRREHAATLVSELLKTLVEDEPVLSEQEKNRMTDLCSIYSLNRSQTKELLLQVRSLKFQDGDEQLSSRGADSATAEAAVQTNPLSEDAETNGLLVRKLLGVIQSQKQDNAALLERIEHLTKEKVER